MRLLVTGGAGFIGSNFIHYMLNKYPQNKIINLDCLTYAGNTANLSDLKHNKNYQFIKGSITNIELLNYIFLTNNIDVVVNFAAESDVDKSIENRNVFIETNIKGTQVLLDFAKMYDIRFIQISTDEVYGSLHSTGSFTEDSPLAPNNPYAASKASADMLVMAYHRTFGLNVNITRCSNNYGRYQHPEKFIPRIITNALNEKKIPIYGTGKNIRDWIHVDDHCSAIDLVIQKGENGEIYNIGGNNEWTNRQIAEQILHIVGKSSDLLHFVPDRPGHDFRYAIDATKIKQQLQWDPKKPFLKSLKETVAWYEKNKNWWKT